MLSPEQQYELLVLEVRHHLRGTGPRKEHLRRAYAAIEEYAEEWDKAQEWCDALMTRMLNERSPTSLVG